MKRGFSNPRDSQEQVLRSNLKRNADSQFGRQHSFAKIDNISDFQCRVPIRQYEAYLPWIRQVQFGESNVLTAESVERLMPSSGSVSDRKLIPYTPSLQREFGFAISCWLANLSITFPRLMTGRAYWSITPSFNKVLSEGTVPIGHDQDAAYLGGFKQSLVKSVMVADQNLSRIEDVESFRYLTLLALLKCKDLRLISVWHPSFLTLLINDLSKYWEPLMRDLYDGTLSTPNTVSAKLLENINTSPLRKRQKELSRVKNYECAGIWPELGLISCWGGGHASDAISELVPRFPEVHIQQKGLIATEAFISLPFIRNGRDLLHPLAIESHFFEFLADDGSVFLVDKLEVGEEYELIVTTSGGLYRYAMNDRIRVNGYIESTPSIEFIGKVDSIADFYGEKLNDQFVARQLHKLFGDGIHDITFSMLAPDGEEKVQQYTLYVESKNSLPSNIMPKLEELLAENPHYSLCRKLGQLQQPRVFQIRGSANSDYLLHCQNIGKQLGDIKPIKLSVMQGWSEIFDGFYFQ